MASSTLPVRLPKVAGGLLLTATDFYTAGMLVYLLLRVAFGERWWPVAFANVFAHWMLLPAPLLLIFTLLARQHVRAGLAAVPALAFVWLFGGLLTPGVAPMTACADAGDSCAQITVLTFNSGSYNPDMDTFAATLRDADVDVVAIQELSAEFADAIQDSLGEEYPYRALYGTGAGGAGLISRYPIREETLFRLELRGFPYQRAVIDVHGQEVAFYNVHPLAPSFWGGYRSRALVDMPPLAELIRAEGRPTILVGDFNTVDQSAAYDVLRDAGLNDAFRQAGFGYGLTFPVRGRHQGINIPPLVRIDFIWSTDDFKTLDARVAPDLGSDHMPVLASLRLERRD